MSISNLQYRLAVQEVVGGVTRTKRESQADVLHPQLPAGKSSPIDTHTASNTMTGGGVGVAWDYTTQWTYLKYSCL